MVAVTPEPARLCRDDFGVAFCDARDTLLLVFIAPPAVFDVEDETFEMVSNAVCSLVVVEPDCGDCACLGVVLLLVFFFFFESEFIIAC